MSRTSRKLDEARFFLRKMEESVAEHPVFDYFLSAFASSARSVTWVMRAEHKDCKRWLDWYDNKKPNEDEKLLLDRMNKVRVRPEKFEPLETTPCVVIDIPPNTASPDIREFLSTAAGKKFTAWIYPILTDGPTTPPETVPNGATTIVGTLHGFERRLTELEDQDVLSACAAYLSSLEKLVSEALAISSSA